MASREVRHAPKEENRFLAELRKYKELPPLFAKSQKKKKDSSLTGVGNSE